MHRGNSHVNNVRLCFKHIMRECSPHVFFMIFDLPSRKQILFVRKSGQCILDDFFLSLLSQDYLFTIAAFPLQAKNNWLLSHSSGPSEVARQLPANTMNNRNLKIHLWTFETLAEICSVIAHSRNICEWFWFWVMWLLEYPYASVRSHAE